ncbi:MAG: hypothetical protein LBR81_09635 [Prevotellaceae bacterium]|jgi:hypothetical protein|nr:hypothetical protein [Prevotellaceae bacterium]
MKNGLKYALIWILSFIFVSVALGHDFVEYCCSRCETAGIEAVLTNSDACHHEENDCCAEHQTTHNQNKKDCGGTKTCHTHHWKVDDFSFSTVKNFKITAPVNDLFVAPALVLFSFEPIISSFSDISLSSTNLLSICGRAILASNCVLII